MPLFVDKDGIPKQVHSGYEGTKYREYLSVKGPVQWKRWATGAATIGFASYIYLSVTCLFEERSSAVTREARKDALTRMKEKDEDVFNAALSKGLLKLRESSPTETPVDIRDVIKQAFPKDY
eukprot:TRINITY_DN18106_c1_g1_i1.p1 TRINITY_DN18106_c1_g1~~TRINITY_DN18106_c1_g1_i1.p1  ORF type:complete len:122 (+),score=19.84 TRINITY_DN18106_c1_g1_i1:45-410(+)